MKQTRELCHVTLAAFLLPAAGAWATDSDTVLLISSDTTHGSTTFVDNSFGGVGSPHTITPTNDAQHSTNEAQFGATSLPSS